MTWLDVAIDRPLPLPKMGGLAAQVHVFDEAQVHAVNMALAAGRPLLVRGEPGTGKSQLARAAAVGLKRALVSTVVHAGTEARDLTYSLDAVERLARAQLLGALNVESERVMESMAVTNFLSPGPLWWAFDWESALAVAEDERPALPAPDCSPENGVVLLIDEIDKADVDVPNGLLEALGNASFEVPDRKDRIEARADPLVILTTNEERALPDAFLRRCLVLHLRLPAESGELIEWLVERGAAHFAAIDETVRRRAAELLVEDRAKAADAGLSPPGQAEYLDLLRAVAARAKGAQAQKDLIEKIAAFAYRKHPELEAR